MVSSLHFIDTEKVICLNNEGSDFLKLLRIKHMLIIGK